MNKQTTHSDLTSVLQDVLPSFAPFAPFDRGYITYSQEKRDFQEEQDGGYANYWSQPRKLEEEADGANIISWQDDILPSYLPPAPFDFGTMTYSMEYIGIPPKIKDRVGAYANYWSPLTELREPTNDEVQRVFNKECSLLDFQRSTLSFSYGSFSAIDANDQAIVEFRMLLLNTRQMKWGAGKRVNFSDCAGWLHWLQIEKKPIKECAKGQVIMVLAQVQGASNKCRDKIKSLEEELVKLRAWQKGLAVKTLNW